MKIGQALSQLSDRRWRRFYFQRRFMRPKVRAWAAERIARRRRQPAAASQNAGVEAMADDLRHIGLVNLGPLLTAEQAGEVRNYFMNKPVIDEYRPEWKPFAPLGEGRHPLCHVANHLDPDIIAAPYLLALANDPRIIDIVHRQLGCRPTISEIGAWWSYPTAAGPQQAENFHRDVDDWNFVKLFLYLTDVEPDSGPHVYVRGSAGDPRLAVLKRYDDQEVFDAFGRQAVAVQTAKAGSAFLENTFGLHKGTPVERGVRLLFQVVYSLHPLPYGPTRPIARFDAHLDGDDLARRTNRVYLD